MDLPFNTYTQLVLFALVGFRFLGLTVILNYFQQTPLPMVLKASLPFMLSLLIFPAYAHLSITVVDNMWWLGLVVTQEILIGMILGFAVNIVLMSAQVAGHQLSTQLGFEISEVLDPATKSTQPLLGRLIFLAALGIFFAMGIHLKVIELASKTVLVIPPGTMILGNTKLMGHIAERFTELGSMLFENAMFLMIPIIGGLVAVEVVMGLVSKSYPAMNVFMISLPLKVMVGLIFVWLGLPYIQQGFTLILGDLQPLMLKLFGGAA